MELKFQKEKISIRKKVGEKEKNIVIEKDIILPDNKPDMLQLQADYSNIYISKKEIRNEKIAIDGGIETRILYLTEEGKSRLLKIEESFSEMFDIPNVTEDSDVKEEIKIKTVDISIINERKFHYRAEIKCIIYVFKKEEIEYISGIDKEYRIQTLKQIENISAYVGSAESKISVKEKVEIDNALENVEVVKLDYQVTNIEKKISYNKILVKADCLISILYQTETGLIKNIQKKIPIMGFLDVDAIDQDCDIDTSFSLQNLNIIEGTNNIEIELELDMSGVIYQKKNIELIVDLYDLDYHTEFEKQKMILDNNKENQTYTFNKKIIINDINQLYDVIYQISSVSQKEDDIEIEVNATFLYSSFENENIQKKHEVLKFTYRLNEKNNQNIGQYEVKITNNDTKLLPDSSVNTDLKFEIIDKRPREIELIKDVDIQDEQTDDDYGLIIYFVKPGDTLWKIAKRFKSTITDITRMNGIENENLIDIGDKLYIPRVG